MTTYTAIPNSQVDQDSPVTQPLMTLLRDNPIAISEGAADAPRIYLRALEGLTAGDEVRANLPGVTTASSGSNVFWGTFGVSQNGVFRLKVTVASSGAHNVLWRRFRNGSATTVDTFVYGGGGSGADFVSDTPCLAGDLFYFEVATVTSSITTSNQQICTNGEDLYPAQGLWGYITGNRAAL